MQQRMIERVDYLPGPYEFGTQNMTHSRIQLKRRSLPFLVGCLLLLSIFSPAKVWDVLLISLGGSFLLGVLWIRSLARGLKLQREMHSQWMRVGDRILERIIVRNQGWAPALGVKFEDLSQVPGYPSHQVLGVGGRSFKAWLKPGICSSRGQYTFGPSRLQTRDPFGIFDLCLDFPQSTQMLVPPPLIPVGELPIAAGRRIGEGRESRHAPEPTVSVLGVREYTPGESIRRIHWLTSARKDELFIRMFDSTPSRAWWICLDADRNMQVGSGEMSTLEHGVILAASLAERGIREGHKVGLISNSTPQTWHLPRAGTAHRKQIMTSLAILRSGEASFQDLLLHLQPKLTQLTSLLLITPSLELAWLETLPALLRRGTTATVLLFDPQKYGAKGDIAEIVSLLARLGVTVHILHPESFDFPQVDRRYTRPLNVSFTLFGTPSSRLPLNGLKWKAFEGGDVG